MRCDWFLLCENEATHQRAHSVLGFVACCDRCADKAHDPEAVKVGARVMVRGTDIEGVVTAKFLGPTSKRYVHEVGDGAFYADDLILLAPPLEAA